MPRLPSDARDPIGPIRPFEVGPRFAFRLGEARSRADGLRSRDRRRARLCLDQRPCSWAGPRRRPWCWRDGRERITSQIRRDPAVDLAVLVIDPAGLNLTAGRTGATQARSNRETGCSRSARPAARRRCSRPAFSARGGGVRARRPRPRSGSKPMRRSMRSIPADRSSTLSGEVVGINTMLAGRRGQIAGMGFALPADRARRDRGRSDRRSAGFAGRFWACRSSRRPGHRPAGPARPARS